MELIAEELKKYLINEGLTEFIPKGKRTFNFFSSIWLISQMALSGFISILNDSSLFLGLLIPILAVISCFICYLIYFTFWEIRGYAKSIKNKPSLKEQKPKNNSMVMGGILVFGFPIFGAFELLALVNNWVVAPLFIIISTIITIITVIIIQNDFIFVDIFRQTIKGWSTSWQSVLRTIPILVITLLISLFSGDIWKLVDSLNWLELGSIGLAISLISIPGIASNKKWIQDEVAASPKSPEEITSRVFGFGRFLELKKERFISIEDIEDITNYLKWRDTKSITSELLVRLSKRISLRFILATTFSTLLLGISIFTGLLALFWILSPGLVAVNWLQNSHPTDFQTLSPILKLSFFISTLQMAAFLSSILDKPKENAVSQSVLEKSIDWISTIIVSDAVTFPRAYIWSLERERNGYKQKRIWHAVKAKIIVQSDCSDQEVEELCKEIENQYTNGKDVVNIKVFRFRDGLMKELESGKDDFNWAYNHNPEADFSNFAPIPTNVDFSFEEHLLGREHLKQGKEIEDKWFGNKSQGESFGRLIWESDRGHHVIMRPYVMPSKSKDLLNIEIRLYKRLKSETNYLEIAKKVLGLAKNTIGHISMMTIFFYYRFEEKVIFDIQWTEDGQLFYKEDGKTKKIIYK